MCNGVETVTISVDSNSNGTYACSWSKAFEDLPGGDYCYPTTGVCPTSCATISEDLCDTMDLYYRTTSVCTVGATAGDYVYSCLTCSGRLFTIEGNTKGCTKTYTDPPAECTPLTTCNGHGCCGSVGGTSTCSCYSDDTNGHWAAPFCDTCQPRYELSGSQPCVGQTSQITYLFASIARTWTMVFPDLAVIFLITVWVLVRRLWHADTIFDLTELRRANLMPTQISRRHQQSLFRSKYIPQRPAKSRCFLNATSSKGAPAY
ncbi:hypothetical protein AGDE_03414 [Angomonas deanei]|uniref:EGF-like domain-containing protein n=1 Tax=Angomonas deanei TaxID=59799 RepID=A0A7G2CII8_9TRYP|nr:hypothetical protein AGDE_03414 [Angomonas deanei]CAD2218734.1 hypothetical protein, conserved [Angomonas deanei]|eukprot:EPY40514.1 hypothetical protein AGDE_03414 [Angomonas deanei]